MEAQHKISVHGQPLDPWFLPMLSCGVYGGRWVGSGLDPCPLASTSQLLGNLPWTASTVRMSVISVCQTALLWKDYHSHYYLNSIILKAYLSKELHSMRWLMVSRQPLGCRLGRSLQKLSGSSLVWLLSNPCHCVWENTRDGLRQKDNCSWPPFTSKAQMHPRPISFLLVSLFSPRLKTILSIVDVQVCWLVVQTQSATELWLKCSFVLSGRERPSPPTPTPGPVGQLKEEGKYLICLFNQDISGMQLMSKPSGRQVVL